MSQDHPRAILAANLKRLLQHAKDHEGSGPRTGVAIQETTKGKVSDSTVSRYKLGGAAANVDDLHEIALAFRLQAWELLCPDFDPAAPPASRRYGLDINDVLKAAHELYVQGGAHDGAGTTSKADGNHLDRVVSGQHSRRKTRGTF